MNETKQEITVNKSVYTCFDIVDSCITNEIALKCYRDFHTFDLLSCSGQLHDTTIEALVELLGKEFSLKEYNHSIHSCIYDDSKLTRIHLANDYCFVAIHRGAKSMPGYAMSPGNDDFDTYYRGMEDNNWDVMFGSHRVGCDKLMGVFKKYLAKVNEENKGIYCMVQSEMGLKLHHIGYPGKPLIETNYSKKVLEGFNRIVGDVITDKPSGCLSIISGPPGSGKTFMVRGVIETAEEEALFVMIPPDVVSGMSGPAMVPLFVRIKEEYLDTKQSVVFIVEDSDSILVPRGADNMSAISTLLNLSDGILGSLFQMRFICTTNANALNFDEALTRPGRLSCRLQIGALSKEEAIVAYNAITNTKDGQGKISGEMTLAEVYALANGVDYKFEEDKSGVMGF